MKRRPAKSPRDNAFLRRWRDAERASNAEYEQRFANSDVMGKRTAAQTAGFRTWTERAQYVTTIKRTLEKFVDDDVFNEIWDKLYASDRSLGADDVPRYGPHNGGVPSRLIDSIRRWYQQPKFTAAQLERYRKEVVNAATNLLLLLQQSTPSGEGDAFGRFIPSRQVAELLFRFFSTPTESPYPRFDASMKLQLSGVTPCWAVESIREQAALLQRAGLPPKVNAKNAFRTFMMGQFEKALWSPWASDSPISDQLIADGVARIIGSDCSVEDVRHERSSRLAPEDSTPDSC